MFCFVNCDCDFVWRNLWDTKKWSHKFQRLNTQNCWKNLITSRLLILFVSILLKSSCRRFRSSIIYFRSVKWTTFEPMSLSNCALSRGKFKLKWNIFNRNVCDYDYYNVCHTVYKRIYFKMNDFVMFYHNLQSW